MKNGYTTLLAASIGLMISGLAAFQDSSAMMSEAKAAINIEDWATAETILQTIVGMEAGNAEAHFELSKVMLKGDNLKGTQQHLKTAIELDGRNEEYRAFATDVSEISSALSRARRTYDSRDYEGAASEYEKVIAQYPTLATAYYGLGLSLKNADMLRAAAEAFDNAARLNPNDQRYSSAKDILVADKYNAGNRLYKEKDWESAIELYQYALDLDPTFVRAYFQMSRCEKNLGDLDAAIKTLDRALAVRPNYVSAIVEKGKLLARDSRNDEAESAFRMALAFEPTSDAAYVGLGALLKANDETGAIDAFKAAIKNNPKNSTAHEHLGEIYSEQEKWSVALDHLAKASQIKPKDYRTHWRLAVAYNATSQREKARLSAKKSVNIRKSFEYGWYELGVAEKALGNRQAAKEAFRNAEKGRDPSIRRSAQYELKQLDTSSQ